MRADFAALTLVLVLLVACGAENAPVPPPAKDVPANGSPALGLSITAEAEVGIAKLPLK